jgi:hypothetical protein
MKDKEQLIPDGVRDRWHLVDSPFYSLQDFVDIKNKKLDDMLNQLRDFWITHIAQCQVLLLPLLENRKHFPVIQSNFHYLSRQFLISI